MTKYTKAVLTVIALSALALPVKAEEKVWYCEITGFTQTKIGGVERFKSENFKMKATPERVIFGSGGFFNNLAVLMVFYTDPSDWRAADSVVAIRFKNGNLHYSASSSWAAVAISARCDDF